MTTLETAISVTFVQMAILKKVSLCLSLGIVEHNFRPSELVSGTIFGENWTIIIMCAQYSIEVEGDSCMHRMSIPLQIVLPLSNII